MKHLRNFKLILIIFISTSFTAFAQSKLAHINTQELIQSMPETKSAQSEIDKLIKTYQTDIEAMQSELDNKAKQFDAKRSEYQSKIKQCCVWIHQSKLRTSDDDTDDTHNDNNDGGDDAM